MTVIRMGDGSTSPEAPVATEPGCTHPDCVLLHPHDGPAILALPPTPQESTVDVEVLPGPDVSAGQSVSVVADVEPKPEPHSIVESTPEPTPEPEPDKRAYMAALSFTHMHGEFQRGVGYVLGSDVARGLVDAGLVVEQT